MFKVNSMFCLACQTGKVFRAPLGKRVQRHSKVIFLCNLLDETIYEFN